MGLLVLSSLTGVTLAGVALPGPAALAPTGAALASGSAAPGPSLSSGPAVPAPDAYSIGDSLAWVQLPPSLTPGQRAGDGLGAIASAGEMLLFGGTGADGLLNSTILYNETLDNWSYLRPLVSPPPVTDFGFAVPPGTDDAVVFGGIENVTSGLPENYTWMFSMANNTWVNVSGPVAPPAREDAAMAAGDGLVLLFGGWTPAVGLPGVTIFNDSWEFNLTTHVWSRAGLLSTTAPGALEGSSLVWQPPIHAFVLYGGCYPCTSELWLFYPASGNWFPAPAGGDNPPGRMDAAFGFDSAQDVDLLYGGTNGTTIYSDTYVFSEVTDDWSVVPAVPFPPPRDFTAAAFLPTPGNATLVLTGGRFGPDILPDTWRLSATANLTVEVNDGATGAPIPEAIVHVGTTTVPRTGPTGSVTVTGLPSAETTVNATSPGFAVGNESLWLAPGALSVVEFNLTPLPFSGLRVQVTAPNQLPIANVTIQLFLDGLAYTNLTAQPVGPDTYLFSNVPTASAQIETTAPGFHASNLTVQLSPGNTTDVEVVLSPLLTIAAHVVGQLPGGGAVSLRGARVALDLAPQGVTNSRGWSNFSTTRGGNVTLEAYAYGFVDAASNVTLPSTGTFPANFSLVAEAFPSITVEVLETGALGGEAPIAAATVNVSSVGSPPPEGSFSASGSTNANGATTFNPPAANYSVTAWAPGFATNDSEAPIDAIPGLHYAVALYLTALPLSSIHVYVRSTLASHPPIGGATVQLNYTGRDPTTGVTAPVVDLQLTNGPGWANFSQLPGAFMVVAASAPGYYPNATLVALSYNETIARLVIALSPIPSGKPPPLTFYAGTPAAVGELLLVPILLLVGAVVYLTALRGPSADRPPRPPPPKAEG